jgi:DNA-binding MarR family transcriptional regulator
MNHTNGRTDAEWLAHKDPKNIGRLISLWRRSFEETCTEKLKAIGFPNFKMAYMPVLMNISVNGTTNNELAQIARTSKQAMSKVVKELLTLNLIKVTKDSRDARVSHIILTPQGEQLVIEAKKRVTSLTQDYKALIGVDQFEKFQDWLVDIIAYHDEINGTDKILKL